MDLVKDSIAHDLVDSALLKATLELSTLVMLGLIKDEDGHQKRLIKLNTGVVYKQQKYNLEREETEGYSKLILLLRSMPFPPAFTENIVESVLAIIGQFDLEPNRVMDVILDCFEQQPHNLSFITLLKHFKPANIVHILGFKFTHYQSSAPEAHGSGFEVVPESLCLLSATLIAQKMIELDQLLPYLTPTLEDTARALKLKEDAVRRHLNTMTGLNDLLTGSLSGPAVTPPAIQATAGLGPTSITSTPFKLTGPNFSTNSASAMNTTAATTTAEAPTETVGPNLPSTAKFLQRPLGLRTGSAWRRAVGSSLLPNSMASSSSSAGLKTISSSKNLAVNTTATTTMASAAPVSTPVLSGSNRAQREKEKEAREKERLLVSNPQYCFVDLYVCESNYPFGAFWNNCT